MMAMLQNIFRAKNVFRSQSMSIIPNFLSEPMTSKCASVNSVLPLVRRTSRYQVRYPYFDKIEDRVEDHATPEERAWIRRLVNVTESIAEYHSNTGWKNPGFLNEYNQLPSMEEERRSYRDRWATFRLLNKIEDVARRLIDENVDDKCRVFYLVDRIEILTIHEEDRRRKLEIIDYDQCWQSLLESSEQQLAYKLREQLIKASITPGTFSQSISKIYLRLQNFFHGAWCLEIVDFGPADIEGVLIDLGLNDTEYECIKILFNLEESEKWQLRIIKRVIPSQPL